MHRINFTKTTGDFSRNAGGVTMFSAMSKRRGANCTQTHPQPYVSFVGKKEN
jgi:hypothetical protein